MISQEHGVDGDVYDNFADFKKEHPFSPYRFGYIVFDTEYGYIPDGCNDWNDSPEEALVDYEKNVKKRIASEKMANTTKTVNVRINFFWDDGDDMRSFKLTVPENISDDEIMDVLKKEHEYLCTEDEDDIYGVKGRNPDVLLEYICNKHGWAWFDFQYDIDVNFN